MFIHFHQVNSFLTCLPVDGKLIKYPPATNHFPNKERRNLEAISSDLSGDVILEFRGCSEDTGILSRLPLVTSQPPKNNVIVSNFHFFFALFHCKNETYSQLLAELGTTMKIDEWLNFLCCLNGLCGPSDFVSLQMGANVCCCHPFHILLIPPNPLPFLFPELEANPFLCLNNFKK